VREGIRLKAEGRGGKAEGRGHKAEGRRNNNNKLSRNLS